MYVEYPNFLFQSIKLSQIGNNATNCGVKNFNRFHVLITLISRRMKNGDGEWIDISALRLLLFYFILFFIECVSTKYRYIPMGVEWKLMSLCDL